MSLTLLIAYAATCLLLALTPGPNMALIIANTLGGGLRAGLLTLLGTMSGLTVLVVIAAVGMTSIMVLMAEWFDVVRWLGALYLVYLGARQLWVYFRSTAESARAPDVSAGSRYAQGLLVAVSNPKVLLFLGAFFPQFVDPAAPAAPQLAMLAVIFVATLALCDLGYTVALARARAALDVSRLKVLDGVAGGLLVLGGLALAAARRP